MNLIISLLLTLCYVNIRSISLVFGIITILAGVLGVVSGSLMGQKLRVRFPTADAVICGIGMLCSAPLFYGGIMLAIGPLEPVYALFFFAMWFLCLNWALVGDMLLVGTFSFINYADF
jgi:MFS transporter, Spinster family, sphingosine-1-phosphate transporter